jgi:hypothetical protein
VDLLPNHTSLFVAEAHLLILGIARLLTTISCSARWWRSCRLHDTPSVAVMPATCRLGPSSTLRA